MRSTNGGCMSSQTVQVPRDEWTPVLKAFSAVHERWPVSLDILSAPLGPQPEITALPLLGVSFEPGEGGTITIAAARSPVAHITHVVQEPTRVWIQRTDAGTSSALEVESADGTKTILRFKAAAAPEAADVMARARH